MSNETKSEIIKSIAYGMASEEIAALEDISIAEVEKIRHECVDEIADIKSWLERRI